MNIFLREIKTDLKPFVFWCIGLVVLVFAGMAKFTGLREGGETVNAMMAAFPKPLQAMFGMAGINVAQLSGYYAVIVFYVMICISIYGISLGANAAGREAVDRTSEFLFTRPVSRSMVLAAKLLAGLVYLLGFSILSYALSAAAVSSFRLGHGIDGEIRLYGLAVTIVGLTFYVFAAMLVSLVRRTEKGFLYGNLIFVGTFILTMIYDMLDNGGALRLLIPMRFFTAPEILDGQLNPAFAALSAVLICLFTVVTFYSFNKKDFR